jgi:hypothetical protein
VPTIDPAQIQASAVAAASTMIAQTQAAMPTDTPVPPTLAPSPTPLPIPTLADVPTFPGPPTVAPTTTGDDCNHVFDMSATGKARAKLVINNVTKGSLNISFSMGSKNAFGQCGYLSWSVPKNNQITVSIPQTGTGPCWWAYAWANDPKHQATSSGGPFCMNNPDKWLLTVSYDSMHLTPP